jgi:hypothetical protein
MTTGAIDDAHAMELVKRYRLFISPPQSQSGGWKARTFWSGRKGVVAWDANLNRAIEACVAQIQRATGGGQAKPPGPPSEPSDKTAVVTEGKGNG